MPRDMRGAGRYPPQPRFPPFAFYSAVRLGDPELLSKVMGADPYFVTQDNGAGAPLHFAVTYRQLDMAHHLLNNGALVNQPDRRGWTPLHRAAHLAHLDGYAELYEYLLSRGADPELRTARGDGYLGPSGPLGPLDVAPEDEGVRGRLEALNRRYEGVPKAPLPHPDAGCWWALYDYGPEEVGAWPADYTHPYPEVLKRRQDKEAARAARAARKASAAAALAALAADGFSRPYAPGAAGPAAAAVPAAVPAAAAPPASEPVAVLFPGQGSQQVGMIGGAAAALPRVSAMLREAAGVLGYDLLALARDGPKAALDDTARAQPALFVSNLAALEAAEARRPGLLGSARAVAGLSLGEYSALVAAGAMSFEDGLRVVKVRAEAMAAAAATPPGGRPHGMLSVVGLADGDLAAMCAEAAAALDAAAPPGAEPTVCEVANFLFPQGRVVSGHLDALDAVASRAQAAGALKAARLAVSGAFHTRLMAPAAAALREALDSVQVSAPRVPVLSNVTAAPFPADGAAIRELLCRQLVEPVRWEATLAALLAADAPEGAAGQQQQQGRWWGCRQLYELGPGQQIKAMVRRVDGEAWKALRNVSAADQ